jgi:hypothetical protein
MSARLTDRQRDTLRLMQPVCAYAAWELDDPTPLHLEGMVACGLLVGRWHNGELLYIITPKGRAALEADRSPSPPDEPDAGE